MKIIHHIGINPDKEQNAILKKIGIVIPERSNSFTGFFSFDLEETSTEYQQLKPYLEKWKALDTVGMIFTEDENNNAKQLVFLVNWDNGYPMPDDDNGYKKTTYDDSDYCNTCGMGLKQKEPFRLKKAPNWSGHKRMFSLNWVYDELFARKDFYESLFNPIGIQSEKVLLYKKETVIDDTVQLIIPETETSLNLEGYPYEVCKVCNRKRYNLINKGLFPSFKDDVGDMQIFKSKELFGTGASARKYIFVSQALRQELIKSKISASYIPCE